MSEITRWDLHRGQKKCQGSLPYRGVLGREGRVEAQEEKRKSTAKPHRQGSTVSADRRWNYSSITHTHSHTGTGVKQPTAHVFPLTHGQGDDVHERQSQSHLRQHSPAPQTRCCSGYGGDKCSGSGFLQGDKRHDGYVTKRIRDTAVGNVHFKTAIERGPMK